MNHITDNAETTASITVLGNYDVGNLDSTEIDSAVWDGTALTQLTIQGVEVDGAWTRWGYSFPFVVAAGKLPGLTKLTVKNLRVGGTSTDTDFAIFHFVGSYFDVNIEHVIVDSDMAFSINSGYNGPTRSPAHTLTDVEVTGVLTSVNSMQGCITYYFLDITASLTATDLNIHDNDAQTGGYPLFWVQVDRGTITSTFTNVTLSKNIHDTQFTLDLTEGSHTATIDGLTITQNDISSALFMCACASSADNLVLTLKNVLLEANQYQANQYIMNFNSYATNTQITIDGLEMKNHAFDVARNAILVQPSGSSTTTLNFTLQNAGFTNLYQMGTVVESYAAGPAQSTYLFKNVIFKNVVARYTMYMQNTISWTIQNVTFEDYSGVAIGSYQVQVVGEIVVDQVRFLPYANTTSVTDQGLAFGQYADTNSDLSYTFRDISLSSQFQNLPIHLQTAAAVTVTTEGTLMMVVPTYDDLANYMENDVSGVFYAESFAKYATAYVTVKDTYYKCDVTDKQVLTPVTSGTDTFNSLGFQWAGQSCVNVPQTLPTLDLTTLPQPIHLIGNYEFTAGQTLTMDTHTQVQHTEPGCLTANGAAVHVTVLADSPTSGSIDLVTSNCFAGTGFGTITVNNLNTGVCDAVVNVDAVASKVSVDLTACPPPPSTPTTPETPEPATPGTVPPPSGNPTGSPNAASQLVAAFAFLGLLCFL